MSNKKKKAAKQKKLEEKRRLEKKKMLLQMQKEIHKLEMEIKYSKITNAKIVALKGMKIILRTAQLIAPYAVAAGITFGGFAALGDVPFYREKHKQKLNMMKELDSFGNIRYEQQYEDYNNSNSILLHYSKWELSEDGLYSRNIETYSVGELTEEKIIKLINDDNILSLQEVLGEPISRKKEAKNNLSEEEIESESFLQAVVFSEMDDDFIMVKQSIEDNIGIAILWIIVTLFAELIPYAWRETQSDFDYWDCIERIKKKHPRVDVEALSKKLEIKRNNYSRLTR